MRLLLIHFLPKRSTRGKNLHCKTIGSSIESRNWTNWIGCFFRCDISTNNWETYFRIRSRMRLSDQSTLLYSNLPNSILLFSALLYSILLYCNVRMTVDTWKIWDTTQMTQHLKGNKLMAHGIWPNLAQHLSLCHSFKKKTAEWACLVGLLSKLLATPKLMEDDDFTLITISTSVKECSKIRK